MTNIDSLDSIVLRPNTPAEVAAARLTVCDMAVDADDAAVILAALGIGGGS